MMLGKVFGWIANKLLGRIDGLKTVLGVVGLVVSYLLTNLIPWVVANFPDLASVIGPATHWLTWISGILTAIGVTHKVVKQSAASGQ